MTEGQSVTAAAAPGRGAGSGIPAAPGLAAPAGGDHRIAPPPPARSSAATPRVPTIPPGGTGPQGSTGPGGSTGPPAGPSVRVNAKLIESALLGLRKPIVAAQLPLEAAGVEEARAERRKLLGQIDDSRLPRLRESGSPVLVALVGSTGAGKSTLVNSIVGVQVSMTGIRRPTTNSPVLACHPDDVAWFAENVFLPTVPRVRQEGLARSGRDGLLVLAANEGMPKGVALLDTPDIDSVVAEHRDFAHQFLDASDLWLFMTSASRYADAAVWDLLQHARDRGAALGIVLSRVNEASAAELVDHFAAMLEANGLSRNQRFLILETVLTEGKLPPEASGPIRQWLTEAAQSDRRVAVLSQTMSGVLDTFPTRVPALAAQVEAQAALRNELIPPVAAASPLAPADAGLIFGLDPAEAGAPKDGPEQAAAALGRASADLPTRAARAVSSWQDQVLRAVKAENVTKRSIARLINFDDESLATVLMIGLLVQKAPGADDEESTIGIPQRLLTSLFGAGPLRDVAKRARADLLDRISLIFDEEVLRFSKIISEAEVPDAGAAVQLYQATYALEVTR